METARARSWLRRFPPDPPPMSQLIIVQGGDAPIRRRIFDRLLGILERRSGRTASDRRNGARSSAAVLPPLLGEAPSLLDSGETGAWTCAAGMWFYDGETGAPALNRIRADLAGGGSLPGVDGMFVVVCGDDSSGEMEVVTD